MNKSDFDAFLMREQGKALKTVNDAMEVVVHARQSLQAQQKLAFLREDLTDEQKIKVISTIVEVSDLLDAKD